MLPNDATDAVNALAKKMYNSKDIPALSETQKNNLISQFILLSFHHNQTERVSVADQNEARTLLYWAAQMADKSILKDILNQLATSLTLTDVLSVDEGQALTIDNETADLIIGELSQYYDVTDRIYLQQGIFWVQYKLNQDRTTEVINLMNQASSQDFVKALLCFQPTDRRFSPLLHWMLDNGQDDLLNNLLRLAQQAGFLAQVHEVTNQAGETLQSRLQAAPKNRDDKVKTQRRVKKR